MVDWKKKIMKTAADDLDVDEQLEAAIVMQPAGMTKKMALGGALGGAIGAAIAAGTMKKADGAAPESIAAGFPKPPLVLGLTSRRLLVWSQSQMSGRPKELLGTIPVASLSTLTVGDGRLARPITLRFADGSEVPGEAPKGTDPEDFRDTIARLAG